MAAVHRVVAVVVDGHQSLDLAGPFDVLRAATLLGAQPGYELVTASLDGLPVRADNGLWVVPDGDLASTPGPIGTLLVVGGTGIGPALRDTPVAAEVADAARRARRVASVCTGAVVLAEAGLLDGRRATTHWSACERLAARHPDVEVLPDRIHVHDGDRWTSAGVTAGIDLALAMVDHDHGPEVAHDVAAWLVVFARRPGGQAQFSAQLRVQAAQTPAVAAVLRWLPDHLDEQLDVESLADRAAMSPRSFARTFRRETGTTPAAYVESVRVEAARRLLETTDQTIPAVATAVGFRHAETLHRAFRRQTGTTPDQYRRHFRRAG